MDYKEYMDQEFAKNPKLQEEYEKWQPEFEIIRKFMEARIDRGLTQKELGKLCGMKQSNISRLESGEYNPTLSVLKRIAEALDCHLYLELRRKNQLSSDNGNELSLKTQGVFSESMFMNKKIETKTQINIAIFINLETATEMEKYYESDLFRN